MNDHEPPYLHGAISLLKECHEKVEDFFVRFERAEYPGEKRKIVEAALYELKIHSTIEELILHPALKPALIESKEARRSVRRLIAELESMSGSEKRHGAKFAALSKIVRRQIREEEKALFAPAPPVFSLSSRSSRLIFGMMDVSKEL